MAEIYINGKIISLNSQSREADSFAVKDGKFAAVGSEAYCRACCGDFSEVVDLKGKTVLPSFFEAHAHPQLLAKSMFAVSLENENSEEGYLQQIKEYSETNNESVLRGYGWENTLFPGKGPLKEGLDALDIDRPVVLWSTDLHSLWVNSRALELAGLTSAEAVKNNDNIEKGLDGKPSGAIRESAMELIEKQLPDYTVEQYKTAILNYQDMAHAFGFTGVFDAMLHYGSNAVRAYQELEEENRLRMRIRGAYVAPPNVTGLELNEIIEAAEREAAGGDASISLFEVNAVKFFIDGVVEGGTAWLLDNYCEDAGKPTGYKGQSLWGDSQLLKAFRKAEAGGLNIHCHTIGDAAVRQVVDAVEKLGHGAETSLRHALTHLQLADPQDIHRFAALNLTAVVNPYWAIRDDFLYEIQIPYLGVERAEAEYPVRSFFDSGAVVASASDFPVTNPPNPFWGIEAGIRRTAPDKMKPCVCGNPEDPRFDEPLWAEEGAGLYQMLESFTISGAYANFLENETGSIQEGKSADFIIINKDIHEIPQSEIGNIEVLKTVFQGETVFEKI